MKTRKLLLTSSQVSVVLTTIIVCCFTAIIFLAGVLVQQQSLKNLHAALKPRAVPQEIRDARLQARHGSQDEIAQQSWWKTVIQYTGLQDKKTDERTSAHLLEWSRYAYAQILRKPTDVCNALIVFAELQRGKSPIPRLLLFPQHWMLPKDGQNEELDTAKRLLKKASRRYKAILVPFSSSADDLVDEMMGTSTLFALTDYDVVATLPVPGIVVKAEKMDELLVGRIYEGPATRIFAYDDSTHSTSNILIVKPSIDTWRGYNASIIAAATEEQSLPVSDTHGESRSDKYPIITTSRTLRTATDFNSTRFAEQAAYVHLVDDDFPSPEYDLPYEEIVKARPTDVEQAFVWEKTESTYKDLRYRVCGLDPVEWKRAPSVFDRIKELHEQPREDL